MYTFEIVATLDYITLYNYVQIEIIYFKNSCYNPEIYSLTSDDDEFIYYLGNSPLIIYYGSLADNCLINF